MSFDAKIIRNYKSIGQCEFSLPDFCVLTGKNGSGKTHLLEALGRSEASHVFIMGKLCNNIKMISFGQLNPKINERCDPSEIRSFIKQAINAYNGNRNIVNHVPSGTGPNRQRASFLRYVFKQKGAKDHVLTQSDLEEYFDPRFMETEDYLTGQFALVFKNYHRLHEENLYLQYKRDKGEYSGNVLTDDEFIKKYGTPPWDFVNEIFKKVNIPYLVNSPKDDPETDHKEHPFELFLIDIHDTNLHINCNDLSTGEKVLMSLAMAIYNSNRDVRKPDILLMDEPDAGLHPSMSRCMIDVIKEFIVGKSNVPVLMTTHSATTVACVEDSDIFEKRRRGELTDNSIPEHVTQDEAIRVLTEDIPFLTVSIDKGRAVYTESGYDAKIYSTLYEIYKGDILAEPHFFPFRAKKETGSNCEDVISSVKNFANSGIKTVYGIVDFDGKRHSDKHLLVIGEGNEVRYAIENFILDPLLVGLLLILLQKKSFCDFGIERLCNHLDIREINQEDAQKIIDGILTLIGKNNETKKKYSCVNGWELHTAESIFRQNGHMLEDIFKEKIESLNQFSDDSKKETNLKRQVIEKIVRGAPGFLSKAVVDTLALIK